MTTKNRAQWDAVRFLTTLNYFGEIPFLGSFRWIQQLLGQNPVVPGMTLSIMNRRVAIVGNCSSELLTFLQGNLSPSVDLLLGSSPEADEKPDSSNVSADTMSSELKNLVRSVDNVISISMSDFRALAANFSRIYQGQNGEIESAVENFVEQIVFDFSTSTAATGRDLSVWGALDDVVMGGVSRGSFFIPTPQADQAPQVDQASQTDREGDRYAVFAGNVSTDNSGGFSSVRTQNFDPPFDFSGWQGMRLRVKGDGQRYKFIARNSAGWDSPAYIYGFDTVADEWIIVDIPFDEMVATFRARSMPEAPAFDRQKVFSLQLMLSKFEYDRQLNPNFAPGTFELAVSQIGVYRLRQGPPLVIVGNSDESDRQHAQQAAGADPTHINYRLIDSSLGEADLAKAIADAIDT